MPSSSITYNPGVLGDEELIRSFVVRQQSLELILETLRENVASTGSNRHLLVVGPRGIGKTMLVRRAAAEVRRNIAYGSHWYPLVFGEESYSVGTAGEFWLEALFHLADQTGESRWAKTVAELHQELDEARLRERALAQLLNFADEKGRRLLLVVENLNMLFDEQTARETGWELRHALTNEPRLMLLGTALRRFEEIAHIDHAWFEMFAIEELRPLNHEECGALWTSATDTPLGPGPLRAIRILTGGNPRLLTIMASFAVNHSFRELMDQLVRLIDDHTEYFKSHLDSLPAKERKVFVALLDQWDPATASELARATRLHVSEASALLGRLQGRGAVEVVEQKPRRKLYQVAERLYNIYYLMRRRGHPAGRVHAAVNFMVTFYEGPELARTVGDLAREACQLPEGARTDHYLAYHDILHRARRFRNDIVRRTPPEFFQGKDAPKSIRKLALARRTERVSLLRRARRLQEGGRFQEAEDLYRKAVDANPSDVEAWMSLGIVLAGRIERSVEAEKTFRRVIEIDPHEVEAWNGLGVVLTLQRRLVDAEAALRKAIEIDARNGWSWSMLAEVLKFLDRHSEAEEACQKVIVLTPDQGRAWSQLGDVLTKQNRFEDAESAFRKAIELEAEDPFHWADLGRTLARAGRSTEAEQAYRTSIQLDPTSSDGWTALAELLGDLNRFEESETAARSAIQRDPVDCYAWTLLADSLVNQKEFQEAERAIRKTIDLHADHAEHWRALSAVLEELGRTAEAEEALRRAIQVEPGNPNGWNDLGAMLCELSRVEEAIGAFRKAVELAPQCPSYWSSLGHLLLEHGAAEEAEKVWETALGIHPELIRCVGHLLELRLKRGVDQGTVLAEARSWVERAGDDATALQAIARFVVELNLRGGFVDAEIWARRAFAMDRSWKNAGALAAVLAAEQKWEEMLEVSASVLDASISDEEARAKSIELLSAAAAAGHARAALEEVAASSGAPALEPLSVGLRIYLGETPTVAKEIMEVAQDVAERIRTGQRPKSKKRRG